MKKYYLGLVLVLLISSLSFAGWNSMNWTIFGGGGGSPGVTLFGSIQITNPTSSDGAGIRISSVTINIPSNPHISVNGPTTQSINYVLCANADCVNRYGTSSSKTIEFSITFDSETPPGTYYATYTITGNNVNCYPIIGCSEDSTRSVTTEAVSFTISGSTDSQILADNARNQASSAISQANLAKSSAQSYVSQAESSCTAAQISFSDGENDLSDANRYYSDSTSYYNSGDYKNAKIKADMATSSANSAKNSFNLAKTYAQSCLAEQQSASNNINNALTSKNSADPYVSEAGTQCTDAQTNWNNGLTKLNAAQSQYANKDYTSAKANADSAKLYFDNAKTAAQNCIATRAQERNAADAALSSANIKITEATNLIRVAEIEINNSISIRCIDLTEANQKLSSAKTNLDSALEDIRNANSSYASKNYQSVQTNANAAQQLATTAISDANASINLVVIAIKNANQSAEKLEQAEAAVAKAKTLQTSAASINVSSTEANSLIYSADEYLNTARIACSNADFTSVQSNSDIAKNKATEAYNKLERSVDQKINETLSELKTRVNKIKTDVVKYSIEYDTFSIESDLRNLEDWKKQNNYTQTIANLNALANKVDTADTTIRARVKEIEGSQLLLYSLICGGIILLVAIAGVVIFYIISKSKQKRGKEKDG